MEVFRDFFAAHGCCLDVWWGLPFREKMGSVDALLTTSSRLMICELRKKLKTTNMHLEGFLAAIKASVPPGKAKGPVAERLIYMGLLSDLMRAHLASGKPDCRSATYGLKASGVALDVAPPPCRTRSDTSWVLEQLAAWKVANPESTPEAYAFHCYTTIASSL
jgi:hypothetical protein